MRHLQIFTDGSVNTQSKLGYGAYLFVPDIDVSIESLKASVKVKRFEQTNSTKLELQTLLWALREAIVLAEGNDITLTAYTDSQNIIGLPGRQVNLEKSNYFSSKKKRLSNFELYQEFFRLTGRLNCRFIKVIGHQPSSKKNAIDKLFSLVDQASRHALRNE